LHMPGVPALVCAGREYPRWRTRHQNAGELAIAVRTKNLTSASNQVEIAYPSGAMIATRSFSNDSVGHAQTLAWVFEHAPGPRLVMSIEGTRRYGVGLARAATTAGLPVIEAKQPSRKNRRGRGKSDSIDAHLAVLYALGLDAAKLPCGCRTGHPRHAT
jgi:hypothetical protein